MEYILDRTGNRPVKFKGKELAAVSTRRIKGKEASRWHELTLYYTAGKKYICSVNFFTQWEGELDYSSVLIGDSLEEIAWQLQAIDPCEYLIGYPKGSQWEAKQARLRFHITSNYQWAVSELLADSPEELN